MGNNGGKRKVDVDLTGSDQDDARRPNKIGRRDETNPRIPASSGQRFGEEATFIPLSQLSQVSRFDEDDEGAIDLVQGSQDFDDAAYNENEHYGKFRVDFCITM
jgi:SWI/SNF-related matrix-associated actin-dependent regulator of chromatin subfamily A3